MGVKRFLTYDEQIDLLTKKNLIIQDTDVAVALLKKYSYFNLINGYKEPFKNKDGNYKKNTKFDDIYFLYSFDDKLRHILMKYLLVIELHIKSLLSYSFCEEFGEEQSAYRNANNYNYKNAHLVTEINQLIQKLEDKLSDSKKVKYINHQSEVYGNVPLWVLVKALTFGNISKMYSLQLPQIQSKICHEFSGIRENELEDMLDILTRYRNVCAHNERLYDFKYNKKRIKTNVLHKFFHIDERRPKQTILFDVIIILKILLPQEDFSNMVEEIDENIKNLFEKTNQIQKAQLFSRMGFPANWWEIKDLVPEKLKVT